MSTFSTLDSISAFIEPTVRIPAWTRPDGVCPAFQWIGQPLTSCDGCGQPYWDHTHEAKLAGGGPFSVRERHVVIPQPVRQRARATWDRGI